MSAQLIADLDSRVDWWRDEAERCARIGAEGLREFAASQAERLLELAADEGRRGS